MRGRQVNADACAETFLIETKRQRKEIASRLRYENYVAARHPTAAAHRPARSLRIVRYGSEADVTVSLREVCLVPIAEILPALA